MKRTGAGRWILTTVAALTAVGGFLADWNRTHLFNPNWPPHAKFHDAQSILLGALLGASGLYFLWRRNEHPESNLALGALLPAVFWIAQGASFVFPGAEGLEAEFPEKVPRIRGVWLNERVPSALMLALIAVGYLAERRVYESDGGTTA
jgi:hypothetical protein